MAFTIFPFLKTMISSAFVMADVKRSNTNSDISFFSIYIFGLYKPRSSSRRHWIGLHESIGFCICYRPTNRGFSHCLRKLGGNEDPLRLYMQAILSSQFFTGHKAECIGVTYYPWVFIATQSLTPFEILRESLLVKNKRR